MERLSREGCVAVGAQLCRHTSAQLVMLYAMAETSGGIHTHGVEASGCQCFMEYIFAFALPFICMRS